MQATALRASTDSFASLAQRARAEGLMDRRPARGLVRTALTVLALAAGWAALVRIGDTWLCLVAAVWLGLAFTQVVFVGHDAGHHQMFESRRANGVVGLLVGNLLTGLSFGWWVPKHGAHHANPNTEDRDPDIGRGVIAFTPAHVRSRSGAARWAARHQALLFFPLLWLEAASLHVASVRSLLERRRESSARLEAALLAVHVALYLTVVLTVLSPGRAIVFVFVQQGVFGLYLGCSFAPNHKGMPIVPHDSDLHFAHRQVITSRNVSGGRAVSFALGGLDHQIEHHLFPTMPRANLAKVQPLVRSYCESNGLPYRESTVIGSYREALRHLRTVGHGTSGD